MPAARAVTPCKECHAPISLPHACPCLHPAQPRARKLNYNKPRVVYLTRDRAVAVNGRLPSEYEHNLHRHWRSRAVDHRNVGSTLDPNQKVCACLLDRHAFDVLFHGQQTLLRCGARVDGARRSRRAACPRTKDAASLDAVD
jgi:hypothetical protein